MKHYSTLFFLVAIVTTTLLNAQVSISTDGSSPHSSAMFQVKSTEKGLLPPVMTEIQRNAIENPASGLIIWCSDCGSNGQMQVFNGTDWTDMCGGAAATFICGVSVVSFTYKGQSVSYGTVVGADNKCWLDRNLGAAQVANSSTDASAYGDLFQWGRLDDGHQVRTSSTTTILSTSDVPGHGNFITVQNSPYDWRSPQNNNLWQDVSRINNPCPAGYRVPTESELNAERESWSSNNASGAFASPLKLPRSGYRSRSDGSLAEVGSYGVYWSSTATGNNSQRLYFDNGNADIATENRGYGFSVRCIKECSMPAQPVGGTNLPGETQIGWNWNVVAGVEGYKYNTENNYTTATDNGMSTTWTQEGLNCGTEYSLYVWSYNACGNSMALSMNQSTNVCIFTCGTSTVSFTYNGSSATYGTVVSAGGKCWLDRNLGATQVATSSTDAASYGDLFQWGRLDDGHQGRTSPTTTTLSNSDVPGHGNFITVQNWPYDWRFPQNNNLWQGEGGTNNPCPDGYRLPTQAEWDTERLSWSNNNADGAFASALKLSVAGSRNYSNGTVYDDGSRGRYWSSTDTGIYSYYLHFYSDVASMGINNRAYGFSVRCLKD